MNFTRCPFCGIRMPEKHLTEHIVIMHPGKAKCSKCGSRVYYSQYSYSGFCPSCEIERIKEIGKEGEDGKETQ